MNINWTDEKNLAIGLSIIRNAISGLRVFHGFQKRYQPIIILLNTLLFYVENYNKKNSIKQ